MSGKEKVENYPIRLRFVNFMELGVLFMVFDRVPVILLLSFPQPSAKSSNT